VRPYLNICVSQKKGEKVMSEYKMNRVQFSVLLFTSVIAVATIAAGILMGSGEKDIEFKPMHTFPPSNVATLDDKINIEGFTEMDLQDSQPKNIVVEENAMTQEAKEEALVQHTENIPDVEAVPTPEPEKQSKTETLQQPDAKPTVKPEVKVNDMPKDRPDSKPSATKGESKLVPDSENPILNFPPGKVTELDGSDLGDGEWGTGDKF
jgi:outer membrane biosynthesis protein TonB